LTKPAKKILYAWIGNTDLVTAMEKRNGPIAQALQWQQFDRVYLLSNYPKKIFDPFLRWIKGESETRINAYAQKLTRPTHFGEIYEAVTNVLTQTLNELGNNVQLCFHLSPGTPAMAAVWIILSKTRFPAELIESSEQDGVRVASVPFDISAEYLPDLLRGADHRLQALSAEEPPESLEFSAIIHRSPVMKRIINRAHRVSVRSVPVLIEGESGTGKELLARAIHQASPRRKEPFIPVNCGAIAEELVESELFGHEKGAFTGALKTRKGHFETANGGTLFLDEIGELSKTHQVKLLRVLQEGEITRVGASQPVPVNVRIIAATNRVLADAVNAEEFREDLYYRLAVAVLRLPPLRERSGDISLLVGHLLQQINHESREDPGFEDKKLSPGARNLLLEHPWPGNIRELLNTLRRAAIWSDKATVSKDDIRDALSPLPVKSQYSQIDQPLGNEFNLLEVLNNIEANYLKKALQEAHENKTRAAELLGLSSYQTLTNRMKKVGLKT